MAYLMHIGFSNSSRLFKRTYYFEYKGIKFKLVQNNPRKNRDILLTIIPGPYNMKEINNAYNMASEFLSAFAWENNSIVKLEYNGGGGIPENCQLRRAKPNVSDFPQIPISGSYISGNISVIPKVENDEQRDALVLFREATSANNDYLAFIFYWQILEIGKNDAIGWLNKTYIKNLKKIMISKDDIKRLPINNKKIGDYFYDDCRNAISHIFNRNKGKRMIKVDSLDDNERIVISKRVIKEFARLYITDKLKLNKCLYLVKKKNGKIFPVFLNEEQSVHPNYITAYPYQFQNKIKKKSWQ